MLNYIQQLQHDWYDYSLLVLFGELVIISWGVFFLVILFSFYKKKNSDLVFRWDWFSVLPALLVSLYWIFFDTSTKYSRYLLSD